MSKVQAATFQEGRDRGGCIYPLRSRSNAAIRLVHVPPQVGIITVLNCVIDGWGSCYGLTDTALV